LILDN